MKKYFSKGSPEGFDLKFPVTKDNFPPSEGSSLVSPRVGKPNGLKDPLFCESVEYEEEISDVIKLQGDVLQGKWPSWYLIKHGSKTNGEPTQFLKSVIGRNSKSASNIVHMDDPTDGGNLFIKYWAKKGRPLKLKENFEHIPFVEAKQKFNAVFAEDVYESLEVAFEAKYQYGVSRPEEVLDLGVGFTHYPEGCPNHPSFPAGHGAVAGQTVESILSWFVLDDEQYLDLIESMFQWAMYRSFSRVHTAQDNLAGLGIKSPTMRKEYTSVEAKFV